MSFTLDLPTNPFDNPKSDAAKEAARLHREAELATERIGSCDQAARDAQDAVKIADLALEAEVVRGAQTGSQSPAEGKLLRVLADAKDAAEPQLHARRRNLAIQAQRTAVQAYSGHCQMHTAELLDDLRPEAEEAAQALRKAVAATQPARIRRDEIRNRIQCLLDSFTRSPDDRRRWALNPDEQRPPLPAPSVVEAHKRYFAPVVEGEVA